jgi:hypothetical protein
MLHLCRLPAAWQLDVLQGTGLLEVAVMVGSCGGIGLLCQLPAGLKLGSAVVARLTQAAEQQGSVVCQVGGVEPKGR